MPSLLDARESTPAHGPLVSAGGLLALASCVSLAQGGAYVVESAPEALAEWVRFGGALIVTVWLAGMVTARTASGLRQRIPRWLGGAMSGVLFLYATTPASTMLAGDLGDAAYGCALAWLAVEVCRAHGVPLISGFGVADTEQLRRTWSVTSLSFLTCVFGSFFGTQAGQLLRTLGFDGALIVGLDQRSTLGVENATSGVFAFLATVVIEDVVIVAAVVQLLTAARRPAWQVYGVVCAVEVALHAYMGAVAFTIIVFAAGRVWLYQRYGGVLPLMIGHFAFNVTVLAKWAAPAPYPHLINGVLVFAAVSGAAQLRTPGRRGAT
ncbi:hypothetical protein IQ61_05855 [Streptomyces scabiei]|nr:hypothetical protein IQ61_05855 [Streptomyces scabiei]